MNSDSSGCVVETIVDVASIAWSAADVIKEPSLTNILFLAWDVAAAILPFVPGSYVAKGVKAASKLLGKGDDVVDVVKTVKKVSNVKKITKNPVVKKAVVIGENMKNRVIPAATKLNASYYKGLPGFKYIKKVAGEKVANNLGMAHNKLWIKQQMRRGKTIFDIGPAGRNSPFYAMERRLTSNRQKHYD